MIGRVHYFIVCGRTYKGAPLGPLLLWCSVFGFGCTFDKGFDRQWFGREHKVGARKMLGILDFTHLHFFQQIGVAEGGVKMIGSRVAEHFFFCLWCVQSKNQQFLR